MEYGSVGCDMFYSVDVSRLRRCRWEYGFRARNSGHSAVHRLHRPLRVSFGRPTHGKRLTMSMEAHCMLQVQRRELSSVGPNRFSTRECTWMTDVRSFQTVVNSRDRCRGVVADRRTCVLYHYRLRLIPKELHSLSN